VVSNRKEKAKREKLEEEERDVTEDQLQKCHCIDISLAEREVEKRPKKNKIAAEGGDTK